MKSFYVVLFSLISAISVLFLMGCNSIAHQPGENISLNVGDKAPNFNLKGTFNRNVNLSDLKDKNVLLVFYPKDNTPGCTIQLCSLRDDLEKFEATNTQVLAINPDSISSHESFAKDQKYTYPLLVDKDAKVSHRYGVMGSMGFIDRTVFLVDPNGVIQYIHKGIQDNEELLTFIKDLNQKRP